MDLFKKKKNNVKIEHHNLDWDKKFHEGRVFVNPYKEKVKKGPVWSRSFHFPLYFGWEVIFTLQKIADKTKHIVGPFRTYKAYMTAVILLIFVFGSAFFISNQTRTDAATFIWQQSTWAGGVTANDANHTDNQTNWTEYSAKDANVAAGTEIVLTAASAEITETNDTDFGTGTHSDTEILSLQNMGVSDLAGVKLGVGVLNEFGYTRDVYYDAGVGIWAAITGYGLRLYSETNNEPIKEINFCSVCTFTSNSMIRQTGTDFLWIIANDSRQNDLYKINTSTDAVIKYDDINDSNNSYGITWDPSTGSIWIANYDYNQVQKIDPSDGSVIGTPSSTNKPRSLVFDSSTNSIWSLEYAEDNVTKIRASDGFVLGTYTLDAADNPYDMVFDSSTNSIWTANLNSNSFSKIRASDGAVLGTFTHAGMTSIRSIAFDNINNHIITAGYYKMARSLASNGSDFGTTIDISSISQTSLSYNPTTETGYTNKNSGIGASSFIEANNTQSFGFDFFTKFGILDPSTNSIWLIDDANDKIKQFSIDTNSIINTYDCPVGQYSKMAFEPITNSIWVSNAETDTVIKVNTLNGSTNTYPAGNSPWTMAFEPVTNYLWIINTDITDTITKIDPNDGSIFETIDPEVGMSRGPVYDSISQSMWISSGYDANKISIASGSVTALYEGLPFVADLAHDPYSNSIWVVSSTTDHIYKINAANATYIGDYDCNVRGSNATYSPIDKYIWASTSHSSARLDVTDASLKQARIHTGAPTKTFFDPLY